MKLSLSAYSSSQFEHVIRQYLSFLETTYHRGRERYNIVMTRFIRMCDLCFLMLCLSGKSKSNFAEIFVYHARLGNF